VQTAITEVSSECRNADNITSGTLAVARGGTGLASYAKGDLIAASGATTLAKLPVGTNTHVLRANSSTATGLEWGADFTGTVTTVSSATAALTVATATTTPALTIRTATTSVNGIVQLSDSTSTTSSILAATPTAVKSAYDLAALALPKAGGTVTGDITLGTNVGIQFEGTTDDANEIRLIGADATADRTITLPNVTGTVITTGDVDTVTGTIIASGTIVNANINNSAAIAYSKLALSSGIVNTDISASAAIALSKLATGALPTGITVASGNIVDGTITNADINASAAIADTKLATISTAGKVSGTAITSGDIATSGILQITNTTPLVDFTKSDGTATFSRTRITRDGDLFQIQTRNSAGVFVSNDYRIEVNASGATDHIWRIANTEKARLNSTGLTVVDDLTISDKIIHAGDTNTAIRFPAADTVTVETNGSEKIRVTSVGNLLIGTTSAVSVNSIIAGLELHALATSNGASASIARFLDDTSGPQLNFGKSRSGTLSPGTVVQNNDVLGDISFCGDDGTDINSRAARIGCEVDGTPGANDMPGRLIFSTTADGNANPTERMRIDSAGTTTLTSAAATSPFIAKVSTSEVARIDSSGRLLVGTSTNYTIGDSSGWSLQVGSSAGISNLRTGASSSPSYLVLAKTRATSAGSFAIVQNNDIIGDISFAADDGTDYATNAAKIRCEVDGTPGANDMPGRLVFSTTADGSASPTERMRIDSSGRLLVGTSTALNVSGSAGFEGLQLAGTGSNSNISTSRWSATATSASAFTFARSRGATVGTNTIVASGDRIGRVSFSAADGTSFVDAAYITAEVDGTPGTDDMPGRLVFSTTADGAATPTEAMRINSAQELLIGYTADNGAYRLQVNSQIFATSATVATSDGRYKENVATLNGCIDLVSALRPVSFDWKPQQDITRIDEDGNSVLVREGHNFPDGKQVGFIAQEVQEVLADKPWLGSVIKQNVRPAIEDADGNELAPEEEFFGIAEGNLTAVLTAALQEAIVKIEALETRITALEA
jgi:hypothetical protein